MTVHITFETNIKMSAIGFLNISISINAAIPITSNTQSGKPPALPVGGGVNPAITSIGLLTTGITIATSFLTNVKSIMSKSKYTVSCAK